MGLIDEPQLVEAHRREALLFEAIDEGNFTKAWAVSQSVSQLLKAFQFIVIFF